MSIDIVSVGQATHPGLVREKNEDSFGWFSLADGELFIVADGMGGYAGGAEASKRAVIAFKEYFESHTGTLETLLEESLLYADAKVEQIGKNDERLSNCGSTIVAFFVSRSTGYCIHAGDSRLYVYSGGKLQQIGRDHSAVQDMLQAGILSDEEAKRAPKNVITQSLGGNIDSARCPVERFPICPGTSFLLCSDGLWGVVQEKQLLAICAEHTPASEKVNKMIKAAIDAGGPDNITAQLIAFGEEPQTQRIPERKSHRGVLLLCSVLFLAVLGAGGYFLLSKSKVESGLDQKRDVQKREVESRTLDLKPAPQIGEIENVPEQRPLDQRSDAQKGEVESRTLDLKPTPQMEEIESVPEQKPLDQKPDAQKGEVESRTLDLKSAPQMRKIESVPEQRSLDQKPDTQKGEGDSVHGQRPAEKKR